MLRRALLQAREQVLIAGWDFDSRILLPPAPGEPSDDAPLTLGELLGYLVRTRPGLKIHVARWDYHWVYRADRERDTREQLERRGVCFYEYRDHPLTGCVHHKIVVIDDALAFCGGIDLTHQRWDSSRHEPSDPGRIDPSGTPYRPVHDTQLCVAGPIAACLGDYLRAGWPEPAVLPPRVIPHELWPEGLRVEFENIRESLWLAQVGSHPCTAQFWDFAAGKKGTRVLLDNRRMSSANKKSPLGETARALSSSGKYALVASGTNQREWTTDPIQIHIWNLESGQLVSTWEDKTGNE